MFEINSNTAIVSSWCPCTAVEMAIDRFYRDISFTIRKTNRTGTRIMIVCDAAVEKEAWSIDTSDSILSIHASDELGVIYALNYISFRALGIQPFWYWCNQDFYEKDFAVFNENHVVSEKRAMRFRGWFINDEVLLLGWKPDGNSDKPWEMAFETLLRLGGNLIIPGTDKNAFKYQALASSMGLWITYHHSEPLGAERFSRVYPGKNPSYDEHPDLFEKLWREAAERGKGGKILWTIGFRGQGDTAFWGNDGRYSTDEARADLINKVIRKQMDIVHEYSDNPVFAFNIYNETAGFYRKGLIDIPDNVIKLFADNGYGYMVSRREWNSDSRISSLPHYFDMNKHNGMYYHVSFYDLQAANHITMIPVPLALLAEQLNGAYENGIRDAVILNVSNIKPHLVPISLVSAFWDKGRCDAGEVLQNFCTSYYGKEAESAVNLYQRYSDISVRYGSNEDNRAGDQYFTYPVRMFLTSWIKSSFEGSHDYDFCFRDTLDSQVKHYRDEMLKCNPEYKALSSMIDSAGIPLLYENLGVHARWYSAASDGALAFASSYEAFRNGDMACAFLKAGEAAESYEKAYSELRRWEHDKWIGFYANEALTDTCNMVNEMKMLMEYIRIWGEGPYFYDWHRLFTYTQEDKNVVLITNYETRMSAYEMYRQYIDMMNSGQNHI